MKQAKVLPGLVLDEELYEAAADGVREHVPRLWLPQGLTWEVFTFAYLWTLVPDETGQPYKAEFGLTEGPNGTVKINVWFRPDRRPKEQSKPHSHPWNFESLVKLGGYSEYRIQPDTAGNLHEVEAEYRAGGRNGVGREVYHEVTDIDRPGRTVTVMRCGPGKRGDWGYFDRDTGLHVPTGPDPTFAARLAALNPHRQGVGAT